MVALFRASLLHHGHSSHHSVSPTTCYQVGRLQQREWSISVKMLFDSLDLLGHIDGTSPYSATSDEKTIANWVVADRRERDIITRSVALVIPMEITSMQ